MEKLGLNLGYILVQIFNFLIIFVVLKEWVYKPLLTMMDKRRETTVQGLEDARIAAEARANAESEAEKLIANAQAKASEALRDAAEREAVIAREIKTTAEADAAKAREAALADAELDRDRMFADMRGQIAALAIAATQKLIGEALDEKRQHALIDEFFSGVKAGKVTVLAGETLSGSAAEITSAVTLTDSEQATVSKDLLTQLGSSAEVA
ncbi:MAG: F0F1 ATP synthase subunit B, partial [Anaerolineae bacterium]|nr:F0F1 ATP synthase subunit B [Anaerolineae bacterium]